MTWVTVCWHPLAEDQLNELWLSRSDRDAVARSANELDQLLRFNPGRKGEAVFAGRLRTEILSDLLGRIGVVPEDVRLVRCGPLEVVFTAHEPDCQAKVWYVAPANFCLK